MAENWSWVGNWSEKRAIISPKKIAIIDNIEKKEYSYLELDKRANKLANYLLSIGLQKGDRVGVISKNRIEMVDLFNATGKTGIILVPFNVRLTTSEIKYLISLIKPKIMVFDETFRSKLSDIKNSNQNIVFTPFEQSQEGNLTSLMNKFEEKYDKKVNIDFNDPHLILFTGGTTGLPKGAILSHKLIFWNSVNTITTWGLHPTDIQPLLFPLFHTGGWNVLLVPFYHLGATTVLMGDFNPDETLRVIEFYKCTVVVGVPTIFQMVSESGKFNSTNFDSIRTIISGGGACPVAIMEKYWKRDKILKMGYGLTEVGPNNFYLPEVSVKEKPLSVGFPVMHCDMKIVDDNNNPVGPNIVGELCLRGPHVFAGYWDNEKATRAMIDQDGWAHTGDLAKTDDDGYYYIVDRKKDMYKSGGENVFPVEVEEVLYKHPNVLEVAVFGVKDEKWGEVGAAAIAPKKGKTVTENDLKEFLIDKIAKFKHPKYYIFYEELPKSAKGTILRREVKEEFIKKL